MKVLIHRASLKLGLRWTQRILFAGAAVALGYCGFVTMDTWRFQHLGRQHFENLLQTRSAGSPEIGTDGLIGRIEILRLGVSALVVEGTGERALQRATGHIAGTALPGQAGNVGIAGHRDTFFRPLRNVQRDDLITLATLRGDYRYRVVSSQVVDPTDVGVLKPDGSETLTLVTCYPFYFVGAAPDRFIVRAKRVL
jgi:sortase A